MRDMDYSDVWRMLQLTDEFMCERHVDEADIGRIKCKNCDYFYWTSRYGVAECLKKNIRDWTLHKMER